MPQLAVGIGAALGATVATGAAAVAGSVVIGTVVGAAVGGIMAAVKGGDVMKGIFTGGLVGAAGGALSAGLGLAAEGVTGAELGFKGAETAGTVTDTAADGALLSGGGAAEPAPLATVSEPVADTAASSTQSILPKATLNTTLPQPPLNTGVGVEAAKSSSGMFGGLMEPKSLLEMGLKGVMNMASGDDKKEAAEVAGKYRLDEIRLTNELARANKVTTVPNLTILADKIKIDTSLPQIQQAPSLMPTYRTFPENIPTGIQTGVQTGVQPLAAQQPVVAPAAAAPVMAQPVGTSPAMR